MKQKIIVGFPVSLEEFRKRFRAEYGRYEKEHQREKDIYSQKLQEGLDLTPVRPSVSSMFNSVTLENWMEGKYWPSKEAIDRMLEIGFRILPCLWEIREEKGEDDGKKIH